MQKTAILPQNLHVQYSKRIHVMKKVAGSGPTTKWSYSLIKVAGSLVNKTLSSEQFRKSLNCLIFTKRLVSVAPATALKLTSRRILPLKQRSKIESKRRIQSLRRKLRVAVNLDAFRYF